MGAAACIDADASQINAESDGKLVHLSHVTSTNDILADNDFGIVLKNSIKLRRTIEVFQLGEQSSSSTRQDQVGGGKVTETTYSYSGRWSSSKIDSGSFKDSRFHGANSKCVFICDSKTQVAENVRLGAFTLSSKQIGQINGFESLNLNNEILNSINLQLIENSKRTGLRFEEIKVTGNAIEFKQERLKTAVGDIRITFSLVKCDWLSVIAQQEGAELIPYNIKKKGLRKRTDEERASAAANKGVIQELSDAIDGVCWTFCCCFKLCSKVLGGIEEIDWVYNGKKSKEDIFESELTSNTITTWIIRVVGWFMIFIGLYMCFEPLLALLSIVQAFESIASVAINFTCFLISSLISAFIIAISWIAYRPVFAISVVVGVLLISMIYANKL